MQGEAEEAHGSTEFIQTALSIYPMAKERNPEQLAVPLTKTYPDQHQAKEIVKALKPPKNDTPENHLLNDIKP